MRGALGGQNLTRLGLDRAQVILRSDGRALADGLADLPQVLSDELLFCHRNPFNKFTHDGTEIPSGYAERFQRTFAFGQHLSRLTSSDQFGMYGTAAAIEVMATCPEALTLLEEQRTDFINHEWLNCFLRTWNYFDLIAHDFVLNVPVDQARNTLRICHMLRAAAAARPVLQKLATVYGDKMGVDLRNDLRLGADPDPAKGIGTLLFGKLASVRVEQKERLFSAKITHSEVYTFRYGTDSEQTPKNIREWLFVWSSAVLAVQQSIRAGIIEDSQVELVIRAADLRHMQLAIDSEALHDDPRCAAFGLWALDHVRRDSAHLSETSPLRMWIEISANASWLHKKVSATCQSLLKASMWQDIYVPYERSYTSQRTVQFLDFFVLPVFPLLIDLVAQHQPRKLFMPKLRKRLRDTVEQCNIRMPDSSLCALPYQNSPWNGIVNCLYFREACRSASQALGVKKRRMIWFANSIWGWITGAPLPATMFSFTVIALASSFYLLYRSTADHDKFVYWTIGILTSLIANVVTGLLLPWLRSNLPND